jgi:hypothetical protein
MPANKILLSILTICSLFVTGSSEHKARISGFIFEQTQCCPLPDLALLQSGDIILRKGNTLVSDLIAMAFPKGDELSHCGLIIACESGFQVMHTISGTLADQDGIRINTLQEFIAGADKQRYKIVRPRYPYNRAKAIAAANRLGDQHIPFDEQFDLDDSNRLYCSELIRNVAMEGGAKDVFHYQRVGAKRVIDMASFADTVWFQVIVSSQHQPVGSVK